MRSDLDVLLERGEVGEHRDVLEAYRTKIRPGARGCGEWECRAASFFWRAMEPSPALPICFCCGRPTPFRKKTC
jgi:hypothetical protein